jgi:CBS domain containing-hemolysin-like protein
LTDRVRICGLVHVRDAARATTFDKPATAAELMTAPLCLAEATPVATGIRTMREHRAQLALVTDDAGATIGIVAMEDLLEEVIGEFDDETDPILTAARLAGRPSHITPGRTT